MASSTAFADGIVSVICSMEEFNYCKDTCRIKEYTPDGYYNHEPVKIYVRVHNTIKEYTPNGYYNHEPTKIFQLIT